jgi:hypothetical protein
VCTTGVCVAIATGAEFVGAADAEGATLAVSVGAAVVSVAAKVGNDGADEVGVGAAVGVVAMLVATGVEVSGWRFALAYL